MRVSEVFAMGGRDYGGYHSCGCYGGYYTRYGGYDYKHYAYYNGYNYGGYTYYGRDRRLGKL
jgi:hypothetical protein